MSYGIISLHFEKIKDKSISEVGNIIGGKVQYNIDNGTFENACALRLSYALNKAGYTINKSDGAVSSGADGKWYLFRVKDIADYVKKLAKEEIIGSSFSDFNGKNGLIIFGDCNFSNASGHVDLFDGTRVESNAGNYSGRCGVITLCVI